MRARSLITAATLATASTVAFAGPAAAAPQQNGLVNVNITDVAVVVPVAVAANVCDINVAVLVDRLRDAGSQCDAAASNNVAITQAPGGGGNTQQQGLVNLNLENIVVAVPIALAANVCDVNVAVLVANLADAADRCDAAADNTATITPAA